jgi:hypothetical protein
VQKIAVKYYKFSGEISGVNVELKTSVSKAVSASIIRVDVRNN